MVDVNELIWETFFQRKRNFPRITRYAFSNELPKILEKYHVKAGFVFKNQIRMLNTETDLVRKVERINSVFSIVKTKYSDFIVSNEEVTIKYSDTIPKLGNGIDEIVYSISNVYVCKVHDSWLCIVTN